jgi:transposase
MAGIDLHSNNAMIGLVDMEGNRLQHKKVPCELPAVLEVLAPYKRRLEKVAVESTYNWYWLVDGLSDQEYPVVLANPARIDQYDGLKHGDDKSDAFFLAELLRLGILPTGYIYDRETRPVRDLLRRRLSLVRQRSSLILSFKSLYARNTGAALSLSRVKTLSVGEGKALYEHPCDRLIAEEQLTVMRQLDASIERIEKTVLKVVKLLPSYKRLQTIPGIGVILGLTITLETGPIARWEA